MKMAIHITQLLENENVLSGLSLAYFQLKILENLKKNKK